MLVVAAETKSSRVEFEVMGKTYSFEVPPLDNPELTAMNREELLEYLKPYKQLLGILWKAINKPAETPETVQNDEK